MSKNRKNEKGKVVNQILGYRVRKMVDKKDNKKLGFSPMVYDKGTYGLYAGKKLIKGDFKAVEEVNSYVVEKLHKK